MTITMNGHWMVQVERAAVDSDHRFLITGAEQGSGVHAGTPGKRVTVRGAQWALQVQRRVDGLGWRDCGYRLGTVSLSEGIVEFDIQAQEPTVDDALVLVCLRPLRTPDASQDGRTASHDSACFAWPAA